jgi:hypothetical protein
MGQEIHVLKVTKKPQLKSCGFKILWTLLKAEMIYHFKVKKTKYVNYSTLRALQAL